MNRVKTNKNFLILNIRTNKPFELYICLFSLAADLSKFILYKSVMSDQPKFPYTSPSLMYCMQFIKVRGGRICPLHCWLKVAENRAMPMTNCSVSTFV